MLLPRRLRPAVHAIYRFARSADDIADEGDAPAHERLRRLTDYRRALAQVASGTDRWPPGDPLGAVFQPLSLAIQHHDLPLQPFEDLLSAFEQDVSTTRYGSQADLLDYCRRSANPVGRLMLHLYRAADQDNLLLSDAICTGLQLVNFWQDAAVDWRKGRIYIPQESMSRHGVDELYIARRISLADGMARAAPGDPIADTTWAALMAEQAAWAQGLLLAGLPLASRLRGRIGLELKLVVLGGLRILERLNHLHYDIFLQRPTLARRDWALLCWRALR